MNGEISFIQIDPQIMTLRQYEARRAGERDSARKAWDEAEHDLVTIREKIQRLTEASIDIERVQRFTDLGTQLDQTAWDALFVAFIRGGTATRDAANFATVAMGIRAQHWPKAKGATDADCADKSAGGCRPGGTP